jgi:hypothetical protein
VPATSIPVLSCPRTAAPAPSTAALARALAPAGDQHQLQYQHKRQQWY